MPPAIIFFLNFRYEDGFEIKNKHDPDIFLGLHFNLIKHQSRETIPIIEAKFSLVTVMLMQKFYI
jgi:hypothetical protein